MHGDPAGKSPGPGAPGRIECEAVRTTIVGGRPPGSGTSIGSIPRGIEVLVKKAAVDPAFRTLLLERRGQAAEAIGLVLALRLPEQAGTYQVRPFLRSWAYAAPDAKMPLDAERVRKNFIRRIAGEVKTIELTAAGRPQERPAPEPGTTTGIRPDRLPVGGGVRPEIPKRPLGGIGGGLIP